MEPAFVDPCFVSLLADPRTALRPPRPGSDMAAYRQRLDAPMAAVAGPSIGSVETVSLATNGGSDLRVYNPDTAVAGTILFIHGGGFVIGSLDTHDAFCRTLTAASSARVVAVEYRLAPETPFPGAGADCLAALSWIAAHGSVLGICGDSAGGHLAVQTAIEAGRRGLEVGALGLLYPVVDPACSTRSWQTLGTGYLLERVWMRWAWDAYLGGVDPRTDGVALLEADLEMLPPTRIITAEADPLRDEGEALAMAIAAAGGRAQATRYPGMIHGFASLPMLTDRAATATAALAAYFSQHIC